MGITVSTKMFGGKELQGWHEESPSAVELRKNILRRGNPKVIYSASSRNERSSRNNGQKARKFILGES